MDPLRFSRRYKYMNKRIIVLFRDDLRIHDHPALHEAATAGTVLPLYILDNDRPFGGAKQWWLHRNLEALESAISEIGGRMWYDKGDMEKTIFRWIKEWKADAVYWNRVYEPGIYERDLELAKKLDAEGIEVKTFEGTLMLPPWTVKKEDDTPYKVFTSFYKSFRTNSIPKPLPKVKELNVTDIDTGASLEELGLLPEIPWYHVMESIWDPGEAAAIRRFRSFTKNRLPNYTDRRDYPANGSHSTLSPYLSLGVISVRSMYHSLLNHSVSPEPFIRQLVWREFSYSVLLHFPDSTSTPLDSRFKSFRWESDQEAFERWTKGVTGYPIIDAGMRELWATGFMHNRVRMVAASFLTKHLLIPWQKGADWFMDTLIDADLANNSMGWQWVAGSGLDSSPYFRVFNPTLQGEKFDSDGDYIRMWVPEISELPDKYIQEPSKAPAATLKNAGITLGKDYPEPMVDHKAARQRALARFDEIKK